MDFFPLRLGVFARDIPISFFAFFAPFVVNASESFLGAIDRAKTL
jgi:hypothetical protein